MCALRVPDRKVGPQAQPHCIDELASGQQGAVGGAEHPKPAVVGTRVLQIIQQLNAFAVSGLLQSSTDFPHEEA